MQDVNMFLNYFKGKTLLLSNGNAKMMKNELPTHYLSLLPHSMNSMKVNLCTHSTKECRLVCLNHSGKGIFSNVIKGRSMRTEFLVNYEKEFISRLCTELIKLNSKGKFLIRLNTFSDIDWKFVFSKYDIDLDLFENLTFYGYTKVPSRLLNKGTNEELVFSYSGKNWKDCLNILNKKLGNVAIVFRDKLPTTYEGFDVINGDESDMRLSSLEGTGKIIGLKFKVPKHTKVNIEDFNFVI